MSAKVIRTVPEVSEYEKNRQQFTLEQLAPYDGQWVAFSLDGKRVVAAAPDLLELDRRVKQLGEDIGNVGLEFIDLSPDLWVGGAEIW